MKVRGLLHISAPSGTRRTFQGYYQVWWGQGAIAPHQRNFQIASGSVSIWVRQLIQFPTATSPHSNGLLYFSIKKSKLFNKNHNFQSLDNLTSYSFQNFQFFAIKPEANFHIFPIVPEVFWENLKFSPIKSEPNFAFANLQTLLRLQGTAAARRGQLDPP